MALTGQSCCNRTLNVSIPLHEYRLRTNVQDNRWITREFRQHSQPYQCGKQLSMESLLDLQSVDGIRCREKFCNEQFDRSGVHSGDVCYCRGVLRTLYPKYEYAAEAKFQADSLRITTRPPNARRTVHHPDTRAPHLVIYNNHGMRQHRNFELHDLKDATNVGFFGDSYMENMGLPGPYSFTEPLDYLLNRSGRDFNVLNFGQSGYGTDQSFLAYKYAALSATLDQVFYVFCINDIRNIYENDLFYLNQSGELQRNPALATPWWIRLVSRLHLTYLLQDGYNRLRPRKNDWEGLDARILQEKHADKHVRKRMRSDRAKSVGSSLREGTVNPDVTRSLAVFRALLEEWQTLAAANGASFLRCIAAHRLWQPGGRLHPGQYSCHRPLFTFRSHNSGLRLRRLAFRERSALGRSGQSARSGDPLPGHCRTGRSSTRCPPAAST